MEISKKVKLTKRTVDAIKPDGTDFVVNDIELIGFGVRVRKTGGMSYIVRYSAGSGREAPRRRVTITPVGKITPDQARAIAKDILASVVKGDDPSRAKSLAREALQFDELVKKFLERSQAMNKPSTHELYVRNLKRYALPKFARRTAVSLSTLDIQPLHLSLKHMPAGANRLLSIIKAMYNWAMESKLLPKMENPAAGIKKFPERNRERFLTSEELERLGDAIHEAETVGILWNPDPAKKVKHAPKPESRRVKIGPDVAAALRLYVLTGCRKSEIITLTWDMVDLERALLILPDSKTGPKSVILNGPAQSILAELTRADRFVIPGKPKMRPDGSMESRPRADLAKPWNAVRKRAGLVGTDGDTRLRVRLNDLRHTHASIGVGSNLGLPIVGKLLGHTHVRTTQRYAHLETDPVRIASDIIGQKIINAMNGRKKQKQ